MRGSFGRNPFALMAIAVIAMGAIAAWEADRIAAARHTVGHSWAPGFLGGLAASIVLAALLIVAAVTGRRRRGRRFGWGALLTLLYGFSVVAALIATSPPKTAPAGSYVATTGIAVAFMTYGALGFVAGATVAAWAGVRMARQRRTDVVPRR